MSRNRPQILRPSKKHIARAERDRRLRTGLIVGAVIVFTAVLGLIVLGVAEAKILRPRAPVATVNGEDITTKEFQGRIRFQQAGLLTQYQNYEQALQLFADNEEIQQTYREEQRKIAEELGDIETLASGTVDTLVQERIIRQEAQKRGLSVTEEEARALIEEAFGFLGEEIPAPNSSLPENPEVDDGSQSTPVPTATVYTRDAFESDYAAYLEQIQGFGITEQDLLSQIEAQLYRERLVETFSNEVQREQEQVNARHILVEEESLASELVQRLQDGESWDDLALEYSEDLSNKEQGGDLGWFGKGIMISEFEEAAFAAEEGEIVGPVQTSFGWHIIQVNAKEQRPLENFAYSRLLTIAFEEWLAGEQQTASIEISENLIEYVPDLPFLLTPQG